jgi:hypothetical protein
VTPLAQAALGEPPDMDLAPYDPLRSPTAAAAAAAAAGDADAIR